MFRRKRNGLLKKLWKFKKTIGGDGYLEAQSRTGDQIEALENFYVNTEGDLKSVVASLFKRLKDSQLETLVHSLESKGGVETDCVLFPAEQIVIGKHSVTPALKFCQFFRFPEVVSTRCLKTLLCCQNGYRQTELRCANPYHYSRIIKDDPPPPPYSAEPNVHPPEAEMPSQRENLANAETNESSIIQPKPPRGSLSTTSLRMASILDRSRCKTWPPRSDTVSDSWCKLAYWELRTRVGRLFEVTQICCNVFWELPQGDGFCLGLIDCLDPSQDVVDRVRRHIGYGFQLTLEDDGIWIYNRSDYAMFAGSPSIQLEALNPKLPLVKRIPPGFSLKVFDYMKIKDLRHLRDALDKVDGPCDLYNVRVSFAKGWGVNYTRRFITSCPSWVEIYINEKFVAKM